MAEIVDLQRRTAERALERLRRLTGLSQDEVALITDRTLSRHVNDRAVADFARVCKQQGLELDYERDKP